MNKRWQEAKISIIIKYLVVLTVASILYNIWQNGGGSTHREVNAELIGRTKIEDIQHIEISRNNIDYQMPSNQYEIVTNSISRLEPAKKLSRKDYANNSCSIRIKLKNDNEYRLSVKNKNQQTPEVVFIEMHKGDKISYSDSTYLAEDICSRITDK